MSEEKQMNFDDDFSDADKIESPKLNMWNYKENPSLIGFFEKYHEGQYGRQAVLNDGSDELVFLPSLTALDTKLDGLAKDDKVKVVYTGEEKSEKSGRTYANFEVSIKKANA